MQPALALFCNLEDCFSLAFPDTLHQTDLGLIKRLVDALLSNERWQLPDGDESDNDDEYVKRPGELVAAVLAQVPRWTCHACLLRRGPSTGILLSVCFHGLADERRRRCCQRDMLAASPLFRCQCGCPM